MLAGKGLAKVTGGRSGDGRKVEIISAQCRFLPLQVVLAVMSTETVQATVSTDHDIKPRH